MICPWIRLCTGWWGGCTMLIFLLLLFLLYLLAGIFWVREYFSCYCMCFLIYIHYVAIHYHLSKCPKSVSGDLLKSASFDRSALVLNNSLFCGWNQLILHSSVSLSGEFILFWNWDLSCRHTLVSTEVSLPPGLSTREPLYLPVPFILNHSIILALPGLARYYSFSPSLIPCL